MVKIRFYLILIILLLSSIILIFTINEIKELDKIEVLGQEIRIVNKEFYLGLFFVLLILFIGFSFIFKGNSKGSYVERLPNGKKIKVNYLDKKKNEVIKKKRLPYGRTLIIKRRR